MGGGKLIGILIKIRRLRRNPSCYAFDNRFGSLSPICITVKIHGIPPLLVHGGHVTRGRYLGNFINREPTSGVLCRRTKHSAGSCVTIA